MNTTNKHSTVPLIGKSGQWKEYILPFTLVTLLFPLWALPNDFTNPMVIAYKGIFELTNADSFLVQLAFYGGYGTMAIPAALFIKKYSYKVGILMGLGFFATGCLLFYPADIWESYAFMLVAFYILTFGLAFLETTANPLVLDMGEKESATRRLNFAQSFNPMGSLLGMLIAQQFVFFKLQSADKDGNSIWHKIPDAEKAAVKTHDINIIGNVYITLGLVVLLFFIAFLLVKIPETKRPKGRSLDVRATFKRLLRNKRYSEGVIAQTLYVGAQIMCWTTLYQYAKNLGISPGDAVYYNVATTILFVSGRFICTFLLKYVNPGKLLVVLGLGGLAATAGTIFLVGMPGLYSLISISFFMSLMFPTIYGIALKDTGDDAKLGAAGLIMAIVGGALLPMLQGAFLDIGGKGYDDAGWSIPEINVSFFIVFLCLGGVVVYGYRSFRKHIHAKYEHPL